MDTNDNSISKYQHAVSVIKAAILKSQARAAQAITHEQLALYYGIGRYVSQNSRSGFWGTGAIKAISDQLTYELPGLKGFSETMIKRMRTFYEEWQELEVKSVIGMTEKGAEDHDNANSVIGMTEIEPLHLSGYEEFPLTAFLNISFTHHSVILRREPVSRNHPLQESE